MPITDPNSWLTAMGTDQAATTTAGATGASATGTFTYDPATNSYAPAVGVSNLGGYVPGTVSPVSNGYTSTQPYTVPSTSTTQGYQGVAGTQGTPTGATTTGSTATGATTTANTAALAGTNVTPTTRKTTKAGEKGGATTTDAAAKTPAADPKPTTKEVPETYTVKAGDTLTAIGAKFGVDWHKLYDANKKVVGSNPNLIRPGQTFEIPGKTKTVKVDAKDTKDVTATLSEKQPATTTGTTATTATTATATAEQKKQLEQITTIDGLATNGIKLIFGWEEQKRQPGLSADALGTLQQSITKTQGDLQSLAAARAQLVAVLPPELVPADPTIATNTITAR